MALISNLDEDGKTVYLLWKEREDIEQVFDGMKNELEDDKTYLSDDDALRGYFFVSLIALYLYYMVLDVLKSGGILEKVSVRELLLELSKVYAVYYDDGSMHIQETVAKVEALDSKLGLNILPKI